MDEPRRDDRRAVIPTGAFVMSVKNTALGGLVLAFVLGATAAAHADRRCVVVDPSGTPLNVRSEPDGAILGALHNGATVRLLGAAADSEGRPWAYVAPRKGKAGWVFRRYIDCR
jgi:uncharacterized protein YraI